MADNATSLKVLDLAAARFHDIWPAERILFETAASGKHPDFTLGEAKDRIIRADRISWVCANPEASAQVTYRGLSITGAAIDGEVDLSWAKVPFPLKMEQCVFKGAVNLKKQPSCYSEFGKIFYSRSGC